jgi:hypothetical protein
MEDGEPRRLKGKSAIDAAHEGISGDDEIRLDTAISALYDVDNQEAADIHANYHIDRIFSSLVERALRLLILRGSVARFQRESWRRPLH